jgi:eukaryotic-like serine/threonine-protein kinase
MVEEGQFIDGFRLEEQLPSGGLSVIWQVSRPDLTFPVILKAPLLRHGENPLAIVSFDFQGRMCRASYGPAISSDRTSQWSWFRELR